MNPRTLKEIWRRTWESLSYENYIAGKRPFMVSDKDVFMYTCKEFLNISPSGTLTDFSKQKIKFLKEGTIEYANFYALLDRNMDKVFGLDKQLADAERELDELEREIKNESRMSRERARFAMKNPKEAYASKVYGVAMLKPNGDVAVFDPASSDDFQLINM